MKAVAIISGCLILAALGAYGQVMSGNITGKVTDPQGAVVSGATVTATDAERKLSRQSKTDSNGQYSIRNLASAAYDVEVEKFGFQTWVQKGVIINVGQTTVLDFHMKVSQVAESVEVSTEPPVVSQPHSITPATELPPVSFPVIRGIVLPKDAPAGGEVSGLGVPDPTRYENVPGLQVVPIPSTDTGSLQGMVVDLGDGRKQPTNAPLTIKVPEQTAPMLVRVFLPDQPVQPVAQGMLPIQTGPKTSTNTAAPWPVHCTMPPVATAGGVQVIHETNNHTSGNSTAMKVSLDNVPATIVAATPDKVYIAVPKTLQPGPHQLSFDPGPGAGSVVMPLRVVKLQMSAAKTTLVRGESTLMTVTITGLEDLPASAWQSGLPPADLVDTEHLNQRSKGFRPPKPREPGAVLLLLENESPTQIRMGKEGARIVLQLHQKDFANGPYSYQDRLQSLQSGGFSITGTLVAFLKDVEASQ